MDGAVTQGPLCCRETKRVAKRTARSFEFLVVGGPEHSNGGGPSLISSMLSLLLRREWRCS